MGGVQADLYGYSYYSSINTNVAEKKSIHTRKDYSVTERIIKETREQAGCK